MMNKKKEDWLIRIMHWLFFLVVVFAMAGSALDSEWRLFFWQFLALGWFVNSIFYLDMYRKLRDLYEDAMKVWEEHIKSVSTIMESVDDQELKSKK